jgi:protein-S-isoprenylcysteine O-methyltransferase Ste14
LGFGLGARQLAVPGDLRSSRWQGLLPRIAVEEAELARILGDQYRSY